MSEVSGAAQPILGVILAHALQGEHATEQQILSSVDDSDYQIVGKLNVLKRLEMIHPVGNAFRLGSPVPVIGTVS
ncbi:MAG: hypothetical protein AAF805_00030 [Planctomycetota bacterium]